MIRRTLRCLLLCMLALACRAGFALEDIRIGILATRPKAQVQAQWEPLAVALNQGLPHTRFAVKAYGFDEMTAAVASRQVDFVLTNPGHYVLMNSHSGLSAPLATLVNLEQGTPVAAYGGVVFTRSDRTDIRRLTDLRGKSVAAVSTSSLGGYQMQALEAALQDVDLARDARLKLLGMPHDRVIEAVLRGEADVGLVRSGILEKLAAEGTLVRSRITIINQQNLPGFPVAVSTRLYPEWLFAAMPHTDRSLSRQVLSFLLGIESNPALARALGIHGFDIPSDYSAVTNLLHQLRMPPFDSTPAFSARDVWAQYRWQIMLCVFALAALLALGLGLALANSHLTAEKQRVQQQAQALKASELRFRTVANYTQNWEYWQGPEHQILFMSPSCERITGYRQEEFTRAPDLITRIVHPDDLVRMLRHLNDAPSLQECDEVEFRIVRRDGQVRWLSHLCLAVIDDAGQHCGRRVSNRDITERKQAQEELRASEHKLSAILESIPACVYLKDTQGRYVYANRSVRDLWRVELQDILGQTDEQFFDETSAAQIRQMDRRVLDGGETITTEDTNTLRRSGEVAVFHTTKLPLRTSDGTIYALCGISTDISDIRRTREALQASVKEKVALLNEVHHRVKNNLQIITSLLRMEARRNNQGDTHKVLVEMQGRIRSMALLHESLYRSGTFASVELGAYLRQLATQTFRAQTVQDGAIELRLDLSPVHVSMDQATPCGLLVNELVSNCLKHGFPDGRPGEVHIALRATPDAHADGTLVEISVRDTGVGLSADFAQRRGQSLGLQLASDLARQLGGTLEIGTGPGTAMGVQFKVRHSLDATAGNDALRPLPT